MPMWLPSPSGPTGFAWPTGTPPGSRNHDGRRPRCHTALAGIPDDGVLKGVIARASNRESFERFSAQGENCGWCSHPIRLVGSQNRVDRSTGEILHTYSTDTEPDGVLLKACGTRRATRCPSCAATYGADARMLVRSGLSGGKGVPESVASRPMVFATVTAPSFGAVHGVRSGGGQHPCRPGVRGRRCSHGRPVACWQRHGTDDPALGEPLCSDCYDYERAVLWNALCPELWRRTTIAFKRSLARMVGVSDPAASEPHPGVLRQGGRVPTAGHRPSPCRHPPRRCRRRRQCAFAQGRRRHPCRRDSIGRVNCERALPGRFPRCRPLGQSDRRSGTSPADNSMLPSVTMMVVMT